MTHPSTGTEQPARPHVPFEAWSNPAWATEDPMRSRTWDERLSELGRDIVAAAYLRGDFVLSSGVRSSFYFDKYLFETRPTILRRLATFLAELVPDNIERLAGPELGAVALTTALSLETGLPFVIVRKGSKGYGTSQLTEGELHAGERVLVVEDVISTAAEAMKACAQVARTGADVAGVLAVLDREQGGERNITAAGYSLSTLFKLSHFDL
jgi:orotate phosphoribosyltransferase